MPRFHEPATANLAQFLQRTSVEQFANPAQWQPVRLQEPDGSELEQVFFTITAVRRGIDQTHGPVVANISLRNDFTGLASGWGDTVFGAPRVNLAGKFLKGHQLGHGCLVQCDSVSVNK